MCMSKNVGGMGFRDMKMFNEALVGNQGPRLLQYINTLVYEELSEKYFPNSSFMEAKLGNNPSLTWRSIREARSVVEKGTHWRVGNGCSICIWKDKWLPFNLTFMPQTTRGES